MQLLRFKANSSSFSKKLTRALNNHFEKAWKQRPEKLPIIGEGKNSVPTVHVKDLARMVKYIFENPPENQ